MTVVIVVAGAITLGAVYAAWWAFDRRASELADAARRGYRLGYLDGAADAHRSLVAAVRAGHPSAADYERTALEAFERDPRGGL